MLTDGLMLTDSTTLHALGATQARNEKCNTQSCPYTWSPWTSFCNASCGGGTRQLISACNNENGTAVALCDSKYYILGLTKIFIL